MKFELRGGNLYVSRVHRECYAKKAFSRCPIFLGPVNFWGLNEQPVVDEIFINRVVLNGFVRLVASHIGGEMYTLTPEQHQALMQGNLITARMSIDRSRSYTAIYYTITTRGPEANRVVLWEGGPYKCNKPSSLYYCEEEEQKQKEAAKAEADLMVKWLKEYRQCITSAKH